MPHFLWHRDFMRRCVSYRSESVPWSGIILAGQGNPASICQQRITGNYVTYQVIQTDGKYKSIIYITASEKYRL